MKYEPLLFLQLHEEFSVSTTENEESVCNLCKDSQLRPHKQHDCLTSAEPKPPEHDSTSSQQRSEDWQHHLGVKTESRAGDGQQYSERRRDRRAKKWESSRGRAGGGEDVKRVEGQTLNFTDFNLSGWSPSVCCRGSLLSQNLATNTEHQMCFHPPLEIVPK